MSMSFAPKEIAAGRVKDERDAIRGFYERSGG